MRIRTASISLSTISVIEASRGLSSVGSFSICSCILSAFLEAFKAVSLVTTTVRLTPLEID